MMVALSLTTLCIPVVWWQSHQTCRINRSLLFLFISNLSQAKRKREKGIQADWRHAGQIFCEMLGQVCHPEIYALDQDEFLEVRRPHMILIRIGIYNTCPAYRSLFVLLQIPGILSPQYSEIWSTLQESSLNCTGCPSSTHKKLSTS
jgi:hypothetical protein